MVISWARRILLTVGLATAVLLSGAAPARAHTDVDQYVPTTGELLAQTPESVTLRFSTDPNPATLKVELYHRNGEPVPFTGGGPLFDGRTVTLRPPALDSGTYVLVWRSIGADGHTAAGQSYFSVGVADEGPIKDLRGSGGGAGIGDTLTRLVLYGAFSGLLGLLWLERRDMLGARRLPYRRVVLTVLSATLLIRFVLVAGHAGGGSLAAGIGRVTTTMPTVVGWVLLMAVLPLTLKLRRGIGAYLGVVCGVLGETLTGHMATAAGAWLLVPFTVAHLAGVLMWLGPLGVFVLVGRREAGAINNFVRRFSLTALVGVVAISVSGLMLTALRPRVTSLPAALDLLTYRYGQVLGLKWLLVLVLVAPVALWHALNGLRSRLTANRAPTSSDDEARAGVLRAVGTRRSLTAEVAGLLLVVTLGAMLASLPATAGTAGETSTGIDLLTAPASFAECMSSAGESDRLLCATRYFEGVVERSGMNAALSEVSLRWSEGDPWMQSNCHSIGHKLGRLGFRIYQDIPEAFSAGSDPCDYGYLHGVIEGASADFSDQELRDAMTSLCEGTGDATNHGYRQCIHGLGHAAARRVNNDLPRAMDFCRVFEPASTETATPGSETTEQVVFRLCVTGVSMEWNTQRKALDAMHLPIGADGTLLGECLKLDSIFYVGCVEYGTSALGGELEREIEARNWCDANLSDPIPCYQSIGRDVIWSPAISDEQAMEVCTGGRGGVYAEQCIIRALGSVATIALDASAIDDFCPIVPAEYQHLCSIVRDAMVVQLEQTTRGFIVDPNAAKDGSTP